MPRTIVRDDPCCGDSLSSADRSAGGYRDERPLIPTPLPKPRVDCLARTKIRFAGRPVPAILPPVASCVGKSATRAPAPNVCASGRSRIGTAISRVSGATSVQFPAVPPPLRSAPSGPRTRVRREGPETPTLNRSETFTEPKPALPAPCITRRLGAVCPAACFLWSRWHPPRLAG